MSQFKQGRVQYTVNSTATSGGTLTLVASSAQIQTFTGTTTHTMVLPDATTTSNGSGIEFSVVNNSTGAISVNDDGGNTLTTVGSGSSADFLLTSHASSNGTWRVNSYAGTAGSGIGRSAVSKSANYTIVSGDNGTVINVDTSSSAIRIVLPAPSANFAVTVKDVTGSAGAKAISVDRNGSELIDGLAQSDVIKTAYGSATYLSDGTNWFKIAGFVS